MSARIYADPPPAKIQETAKHLPKLEKSPRDKTEWPNVGKVVWTDEAVKDRYGEKYISGEIESRPVAWRIVKETLQNLILVAVRIKKSEGVADTRTVNKETYALRQLFATEGDVWATRLALADKAVKSAADLLEREIRSVKEHRRKLESAKKQREVVRKAALR